MTRFRLTVEVGSARAPARRPLRRTARPSLLSSVRHRIAAIPMPSPQLRRLGLAAVLIVAVLSVWDYLQPINAVAATGDAPAQSSIPGASPVLPWPDVGSAAIGASSLGLIATSGKSAPTPMASVAKVMTALVVLDDKPMALGEAGATLVITDQDVAAYNTDAAQQQSVVQVVAGEQLNEFQALEALLVGSGNNIAETLARWDAGSMDAFVTKMNQRASQLHLAQTTFADPAGVSVQTVSTPADLVALGIAAMKEAVFAQIVSLPQVTLPVAGIAYNVNSSLGVSGIVGIKTGFGLNLGANFLFAAAATVDGQPVTLFGCLTGQPTLDAAFQGAEDLIGAMKSALHVRLVVALDSAVGAYTTGWGSRTDIIPTTAVTLVEWPGMKLRRQLEAPAQTVDAPVPAGSPAGRLLIALGDQSFSVPLVTASGLDPPGFAWRLWRI